MTTTAEDRRHAMATVRAAYTEAALHVRMCSGEAGVAEWESGGTLANRLAAIAEVYRESIDGRIVGSATSMIERAAARVYECAIIAQHYGITWADVRGGAVS